MLGLLGVQAKEKDRRSCQRRDCCHSVKCFRALLINTYIYFAVARVRFFLFVSTRRCITCMEVTMRLPECHCFQKSRTAAHTSSSCMQSHVFARQTLQYADALGTIFVFARAATCSRIPSAPCMLFRENTKTHAAVASGDWCLCACCADWCLCACCADWCLCACLHAPQLRMFTFEVVLVF